MKKNIFISTFFISFIVLLLGYLIFVFLLKESSKAEIFTKLSDRFNNFEVIVDCKDLTNDLFLYDENDSLVCKSDTKNYSYFKALKNKDLDKSYELLLDLKQYVFYMSKKVNFNNQTYNLMIIDSSNSLFLYFVLGFLVFLILLCLALCLSLFFTAYLSRKIINPLINLDEENIFKEFNFLLDKFNDSKEDNKILREEFSANVTHELRTPLTSIMLSAEMINNDMVKQEDIRVFVDKIYKESSKLLEMIDDVLALSFLDENNEIQKQRVSLKDIVLKVDERLKLLAEQKNIQVVLALNEAYIYANALLIENMIFNIYENAIKYSFNDSKIDIKLKTSKKHTRLYIQDYGIGIGKEYQDRIFERFYRVNHNKKRAISGSGLGLSLVKKIARLHRIKTYLISSENKGCKFILEFRKVQ